MLLLGQNVIAALASGPWPALQRDAQRTGHTATTGPITDTLRWEMPTGSAISSSPAVASDGTIYFGAWNNQLYAINKNGFIKWAFSAGNAISSSPAIGPAGTVYFGSYDGNIYAVHPDGTKNWEQSTGDIVTSSPIVASDGTIYIGSWDDKVYAFNPDGSLKWDPPFTTGGDVSSSPALSADENTLYVGSWDGYLYAIDTSDGSEAWKFMTGSAISGSPAVGSDGTVYIGSWDGKLYAVDPATASELWSYTTDGYIRSSPALADDGTIYISASWVQHPVVTTYYYEELYAIQPPTSGGGTGTSLWEVDLGSSGGSGDGDQIVSLAAVDGGERIYIGGKDFRVHAVDPTDGSDVWSYLTDNWVDASPAIDDNGVLYVGSWDGKLYAFGPLLSQCSNRDFDADGRITVADLIHLSLRLGKTSSDADWNSRYNLDDSNSEIDVADLVVEAGDWQTVCSS